MRESLLTKNRLESFSDGVMAIIVTIMMLNIPLPTVATRGQILRLIGNVLIYFVSFFLVGYYWWQHYRMFAHLGTVTGKVIWRNMLFLFALSLLPVFTKWIIVHFGETVPAVGYVLVFLLVNASSRLLFHAVMDENFRQVMRRIRPASIGRTVATVLTVIGLIAFSAVMPELACILLIGLPVVLSLSNLLFEREPGSRRGHPRKTDFSPESMSEK